MKAIVEADGTVVDTPDAERSRVVREDTARQVMAMMEATGDGGTAPSADSATCRGKQELRSLLMKIAVATPGDVTAFSLEWCRRITLDWPSVYLFTNRRRTHRR